jgi:hypothetical protein
MSEFQIVESKLGNFGGTSDHGEVAVSGAQKIFSHTESGLLMVMCKKEHIPLK